MWKTFRKPFAVATLLALAACPGPGQEIPKDSPEKVVQEQVDAYNRHDLDAFLGFYAPDVKLHDFPGKETTSGVAAMRETYGKLFANNPDLKVDILKRIVQGDTVIDQEAVMVKGKRRLTAVAIYRIASGKIAAVWFVK
jgi:uncharacterized protein (TIGR02246 family)